jgi:phage I-like protein
MAAPPTREVPGFTGRPVSYRAPLTQDERDVAKGLGISTEEYSGQKEKMERLKTSGAIQ